MIDLSHKIAFCPITGCWIWVGARNLKGYGHVTIKRKTFAVHRVMYENYKGPIPEGFQIDHLCRVPSCCNPDHLEAVTQRENLMRGKTKASANASKTKCRYGHEYSFNRNGSRYCKKCHVATQRLRRSK